MAGQVRMNGGNSDFKISLFEASEITKKGKLKLFLDTMIFTNNIE